MMREIRIRPVLNGFVVNVGCQELVFRDIQDVGRELIRYQENPDVVEKEYIERAVNKMLDAPTPLGTNAPPLVNPMLGEGISTQAEWNVARLGSRIV